MKKTIIIFAVAFLTVCGCSKSGNSNSGGTETIETTLFGTGPYYALGFSFSTGSQVSTLASPGPDITLLALPDNEGNVGSLMLQADNFKDSFFKFGEYSSNSDAQTAYNNLTSASVSQWEATADSVKPYQVWLYRTGSDTYAKFRIVSTVGEIRSGIAYGSCTFQWKYQPDGTLTFPSK